MNGIALLGRDRPHAVYRLAHDIEDTPQHLTAHWHGDRLSCILDRHATRQAIGGLHSHSPHGRFAQVLGHLGRDLGILAIHLAVDLQGIVDGRQIAARKLHVHDRSNDLDDFTCAHTSSVYWELYTERCRYFLPLPRGEGKVATLPAPTQWRRKKGPAS